MAHICMLHTATDLGPRSDLSAEPDELAKMAERAEFLRLAADGFQSIQQALYRRIILWPLSLHWIHVVWAL